MKTLFLNFPTARQWKRLGTSRRAGVAAPLFSIYSSRSVGIGDFSDLKLLIDWAASTGMSLIQLLPMNDTGSNFRPYDSTSSFALDPMYLALEALPEMGKFKKEISELRNKFPCGKGRVDYGIKAEKLELLRKVFSSFRHDEGKSFNKFCSINSVWLDDYTLFKVLKETYNEASWESWPEEFRRQRPKALESFAASHSQEILFHKWLQWHAAEQLKEVKNYAAKKGVYLIGDLPFLVSRDSADVWAHPEYFKLELAAGAPPDAYIARGQRWGMPPYNWQAIEQGGFLYIKDRLKFAEQFYDLFRIDHAMGMFRLWSIPVSEPQESGGLKGFFDPSEKEVWEAHGKKIFSVFCGNTSMLPLAEDLGMVPECSNRALAEFGIPGTNVQRWTKDWEGECDFSAPAAYRPLSVVMLSTHDSSSFRGWWEHEAGTVDAEMFERKCAESGIDFNPIREKFFEAYSAHGRLRWRGDAILHSPLGQELSIVSPELTAIHRASFNEKEKFWKFLGLKGKVSEKCTSALTEAALVKAAESASIFTVHLLQDWLSLRPRMRGDSWYDRVNFPGILDEKNWTYRVPFSLEELQKLKLNKKIKKINSR